MKRRTFVGVAGMGVLGVAGCTHSRTEPEADGSEDGSTASEPSGADDGGDENGADDDGNEDAADKASETIAVGELVGDELEFVVSDVDRRRSFAGLVPEDDGSLHDDDERGQASADAAFVVVEFAVRNASDEFVSTADVLEPVLEDDAERTHSGVRSVSEQMLADGVLAPGEVERGEVAYELSRDRSGSSLTLEAGATALGEDLVVDLEREADEVATLEQELRVPIREFGAAIERDGLDIGVDRLGTGNDLGSFFEPEPDHEYVVVGLTVTNEAGEDREFSLGDRSRLKDGVGRSYPADPDALSSLERFDDSVSLADGDRYEGSIAYHVERDREELYWLLEPPSWTDEKEFWRIR
ncbi:DUF4352 domain-containing protein [Natronococcus occultus]|uniref:Telomeric repeat-binding factor 2 n=1 Tax=Natronococcus occultus SP4 TaxID=694430 RepID=L0JV14_9EURY|nr:DUF4352 domain-containing protein [Natronococcus occultus]AGB36135.1 Telomeric repeat-binding factor 2 [Natronococcus occultus SP4]